MLILETPFSTSSPKHSLPSSRTSYTRLQAANQVNTFNQSDDHVSCTTSCSPTTYLVASNHQVLNALLNDEVAKMRLVNPVHYSTPANSKNTMAIDFVSNSCSSSPRRRVKVKSKGILERSMSQQLTFPNEFCISQSCPGSAYNTLTKGNKMGSLQRNINQFSVQHHWAKVKLDWFESFELSLFTLPAPIQILCKALHITSYYCTSMILQ